jgi:hypothetical protein
VGLVSVVSALTKLPSFGSLCVKNDVLSDKVCDELNKLCFSLSELVIQNCQGPCILIDSLYTHIMTNPTKLKSLNLSNSGLSRLN